MDPDVYETFPVAVRDLVSTALMIAAEDGKTDITGRRCEMRFQRLSSIRVQHSPDLAG